jgi:hypothetical protein
MSKYTPRWTHADIENRTPRTISRRLGGDQQIILRKLKRHSIYPVSREPNNPDFLAFTRETRKALTALFEKGLIEWYRVRQKLPEGGTMSYRNKRGIWRTRSWDWHYVGYAGPYWDVSETGPQPNGRCIRPTALGYAAMDALGW